MSLNLDKSNWKRVAFGDVVDSITDRVDNPSEAGVDRYVGLEHLDPGVMTVQRWDSPDRVEAQKLRFFPGDVIFGRRRAYQKKVAKADFEGICSAHALVLRARPGYVDPDFLPVFLASDYFLERTIEISVGSLSPTVNWRDLKIQKFDLPPLDEQKRIAELLWAVESECGGVRRTAMCLAEVEAAWVDAACGSSKMTYPLGRLLTRVFDRRGVTPKKLGGEFVDAGVPVLSAMNVVDGEIDYARQERYVTSDVAARWMSGPLMPGDILMTSEAPLGSVVLVTKPTEVCLGQRLFGLRVDQDIVLPEYLYGWLRSAAGQSALASRASGTTVKGIRQSELMKVEVPVLETAQQSQFIERWRSMQAVEGHLSARLAGAMSLRAALSFAFFRNN